jgi:hypothetical protein
VLGYHHPLRIAKQYGTLDLLSGGRVILGVGIGSLTAEFKLLRVERKGRAARTDDAIRALRASMSTPMPEYHGPFFSYAGMSVRPHSVSPRVPIWVGGKTIQSLRRAARLADGWMPFGLTMQERGRLLTEVDAPPDFEVVLPIGHPIDPGTRASDTRRRLEELRDAGATIISCTVAARSAAHYCEQLAALKELADTT